MKLLLIICIPTKRYFIQESKSINYDLKAIRLALQKNTYKVKEIQDLWNIDKDALVFKELVNNKNLSLEDICKLYEANKTDRKFTDYHKTESIIKCGVYSIYNKILDIYYIGSSKDCVKRYRNHKKELKDNLHNCEALQRDFNKYGEDSFALNIIKETSTNYNDMNESEFNTIKEYHNKSIKLYNQYYNDNGKKIFIGEGVEIHRQQVLKQSCSEGKPIIHTYNGISKVYNSLGEASVDLDISKKRIAEVLKGKKCTGTKEVPRVSTVTQYKGHTFKYVDDKENHNRQKIGKITSVFGIINKTNGKIFIKDTIDTSVRISTFKNYLQNAKTTTINKSLVDDVRRLGIDNFEFKILELCERENLLETKEKWEAIYKDNLYK